MGFTIHWEGSTRSLKNAKASVEFVKQFAHALGLIYHEYEDVGVVVEDRIYKENGEIYYKWISFYRDRERDSIKEEYILEESECFGVIVIFPEPVNIESFDFQFFKHGRLWKTRGFCKTQVFRDEEIYNLYAHIVLTSILMTIKHTWIPNMEIWDEACYYLPIDKRERKKHVEEHIAEGYRDYYMKLKPFNFLELAKAHGALRDLINLTAEALRELGHDVKVGVELRQTDLSDYV